MSDQPPASVRLPSSEERLQALDATASAAAMVLAFLFSAGALWLVESGTMTLILLTAGFALVLARLRSERAAIEARLGLHEQLELARAELGRSLHGQARSIAQRVAEQARQPQTQRVAIETLAWCELGLGRPLSAKNALSWIRPLAALDAYCCAAVEDACGNSRWALHLLEAAARRARLPREATLFWIDLCARVRGADAACQLTLRELRQLEPADARRVLEFAGAGAGAGAGEGSAAARSLAEALGEAPPISRRS